MAAQTGEVATGVAVGGVSLAPATEADAALWDNIVAAHPEGRFSQLWGFRRVLEQYRYRCVYYKILNQGGVIGVFPAIVSPSGRRRLISQPFIEYGGPLLPQLEPQQYEQVAQALVQLAEEQGCHSLEIRGGIGMEPFTGTLYCVKHPLYQYAELALADPELLWRKSLTNEARKGVNKSRQGGMAGEIRRGGAAVAGEFYPLYLVSMKRLGAPPHALRFFQALADGLGENLVASWVLKDGDPAAVLLGAISGSRLQIYITASSPRYWAERPNDLAHWEMIAWAAKQGIKILDFGSARYPGQIQFKKKWGVEMREYSYLVMARPGSDELRSIGTLSTSSGFMTRMSDLWQKLMPVGLTRVLGPPIRRYLTK